jgi:eukaryotic-like serine/threonine-protein kinase
VAVYLSSVQQTVLGSGNIFSGSGSVFVYQNPLPAAEARTRVDLHILLNKVKAFWIEGVLEKSLYQSILIDLGKKVEANAVDHPWESILELPNSPSQFIPGGQKIVEIFDRNNRGLLILGEPGSGKTITLLELARDLIARAERDDTVSQPIPVVFNLSSWTDKRQSLTEWILAELAAKYRVPTRLGRTWLEENRLLPLLDGLDEVNPQNRAACVETINSFCANFGLAGLVVCSRLQEYTDLPVRLKLNAAICLQPLHSEQIDNYVATVGSELDALYAVLRQDETLLTLAQSPLMLSIMTLAYRDAPTEDWVSQSHLTIEDRCRMLFDAYIDRMFKRKGQRIAHYSDNRTLEWLTWLARKMSEHKQSIFLIEGIQPSWLSTNRQRWGHTVIVMLVIGIPIGLLVGIGGGFPVRLGTDPVLGLAFSVGLGLAASLTVCFAARRSFKLISSALVGSAFGLTFGVSFGLYFGASVGAIVGVSVGLAAGLAFNLVGKRLHGSAYVKPGDIELVETLSWSWTKAMPGLVTGLIAGYAFGWIIERAITWQLVTLNFGPAFGIAIGLVTGIASGLTGSKMETRTVPNQGIWKSARNAIRIGLAVSVAVGLPIGIACGTAWKAAYLLENESTSLTVGLVTGGAIGLAAGIAVGLLFGGAAFIQHFSLRLLLYLNGDVPWNYARFLDYAAERIFLRKVGGGYIFIHRLLMEHFVTLKKKPQCHKRTVRSTST